MIKTKKYKVSYWTEFGKVTVEIDSSLPKDMSIEMVTKMAIEAKKASDKAREDFFNTEKEDTPYNGEDVNMQQENGIKTFTAITPKKNSHKIVTLEKERPAFRDRLPNQVLLSDLDIKQAVTENALVRCPKCGQSHVLAILVNGNIQFMSKRGREFKRIAVCRNEHELMQMSYSESKYKDREPQSFVDYYNDIKNIETIEDPDIVIEDSTGIFCPVCHKENCFSEWKKAWDQPLLYYDYEHPCECCGGETVISKAGQDGEVLFKCESCSHEFKE